MPGYGSPGGSAGITDDERVFLTIGGIIAAGGLLGSAALVWRSAIDFLVAHHVLARSSAVLLRLPWSGGAGLDLARLSCVAGVLLAVCICVISAVYHWRKRRDTV